MRFYNRTNHRASPYQYSGSINHKVVKFRKLLFRPKMIVVLALLLCWNHRDTVAVFHSTNGGTSFHQHHHQQQQRAYHLPNSHHYHPNNNARLNDPPPLYSHFSQLPSSDSASSKLPLGQGEINTFSDETALVGPVPNPLSMRPPLSQSISFEYPSPVARPTQLEMSGPKTKKRCQRGGETSRDRATRGLLSPVLKRSYFAFTQDEVNQKVKDDEYRQASERKKREVHFQQLGKRSGSTESGSSTAVGTGGGTTEAPETPLPWTCETIYEWTDMGEDHYPRFVRTAECKNRNCFNGFFRCKARRYKTKILKRLPSSETSCEEDDVSLPEVLRSNWQFVTVTINLCCDCTGRLPSTNTNTNANVEG